MGLPLENIDFPDDRIRAAWAALGITCALLEHRKLPLYAEARRLAPVGLGPDGRDKLLQPTAAKRWRAMQQAAARDGIELLIISGFRSIDYQTQLLRRKVESGRSLQEALTVIAPPGCSEHHTGCAIDIGTPGAPPVEESFELTAAFKWLEAQAAKWGFHMTYPRDNEWGFIYEPWHWRFHHDR